MKSGQYWKRKGAKEPNIRQLELQHRALELRRQGLNYHEIARELKISTNRAYELVQSALTRWMLEPAEDVRLLELQRLDALLAALWDKAIAGDLAVVDRVLRIMERRAKLLGLDQIEVVSTDLGIAVLKLLQKLPSEEPTPIVDGEYRQLSDGHDAGHSDEEAKSVNRDN